MKKLLLLLPISILLSFTSWQSDFRVAKETALSQHKLILLNFSGSDWCGPCIMFRKEVLNDSIFQQFADSNLVMFNADFPRQKKNQLTKDQQKQNSELADLYNKTGIFPKTLLLSAEGKVLKIWEGKPKENSNEFIQQIKNIIDTRK